MIRRGKHHIFRILSLFVVLAIAVTAHAQCLDSRSFDQLWTRYYDIRSGYVQDQQRMLDTIGWKAEAEHNELQRFHVNFERISLTYSPNETEALLLANSLSKTSPQPYCGIYHYLISKILSTFWATSTINMGSTELADVMSWSKEELSDNILNHEDTAFQQLFHYGLVPADDFRFMTTPGNVTTLPGLTLLDVVLTSYLQNTKSYLLDRDFAIDMIDSIIEIHRQRGDTQLMLEYEIMRLNINSASSTSLSNPLWNGLAELERHYGSNHALEYEKGICLYAYAFDNDTLPQEERRRYLIQCAQAFHNVVETAPDTFYQTNADLILEKLTQKEFSVQSYMPTYLQPSAKHLIPIKYRNVDTLYVSVYRIRDYEDFILNTPSPSKALLNKEMMQQQRYVLPQPVPYIQHTSDLWLDSLPIGNYILQYHTRPDADSGSTLVTHELTITRITALENTIGRKSYISFVDSRTGAPLAGLKVRKENFSRDWGSRSSVYTNRKGCIRLHAPSGKHDWLFTVNDGKECVVFFDMGDFPEEYATVFNRTRRRYYYNYTGYRYRKETEIPSRLVLDRPLYRAGQQLHFKAYLVHGHQMAAHRRVLVALLDRNYQKIDSLELETNDFGTVSGTFKLPENLTGYGTIDLWDDNYDRYAEAQFEIAAYKLPTFKVVLENPGRQYAIGDTLQLSGKAVTFTGDPVSFAQVVVTAKTDYTSKVTLFLETDARGRFSFSIATSDNANVHGASWDNLTVNAVVTDRNGETQSGEKSYKLRKDALFITLDDNTLAHAYYGEEHFNPIDLAKQDTLRSLIEVKTFTGKVLTDIPVKVEMHKLTAPDTCKSLIYKSYKRPSAPLYSSSDYRRYFPQYTFEEPHERPESWPIGEKVYLEERVFSESTPWAVRLTDFEPGIYILTFSATDSLDRTTTKKLSLEIRNTARKDAFKGLALKVNILERTKHRIVFLVTSDLDQAQVACHVYQGLQMRQKQFVLNHRQKVISMPIRERPGAVYVDCQTVQHDIVYRSSDRRYYWGRKHFKPGVLEMNMIHWRSLLHPGSQEHWTVEVRNASTHKPVKAEVLAWMVDTSLLALNAKTYNPWILPYEGSYRASPFDGIGTFPVCYTLSFRCVFPKSYRHASKRQEMLKQYPHLDMEHLSTSEFQTFSPYFLYGSLFRSDNTGRLAGENIRTTPGRSVSIDEITPFDLVETELIETPSAENDDDGFAGGGLHPFRIRDHFTETAFFLPHLRTDHNGRTDFEFTVPDQFTTWQFYALAHTKGLKTGKLQGSMVSKMPLMLQTNAPRFLREGDTLTLRAKVTNLTEYDLEGEVTVEFFNAEDNNPVKMVVDPNCRDAVRDSRDVPWRVSTDGKSQFSVTADASQTVQFRIIVPADIPAIGYRMVARAGNYGDGEERLLPVLPNKMLVTESHPFVVAANTDTAFVFNRYRTHATPTMQPLSYTVEVTTNPTWLAIRSLPFLMRYPYECNEQTFSKLFAAATVQHALAQSPGLDSVFRSWLADTVNQALASPLLKNKSMQGLLLEETPWLRDAQNESQQRMETAKLFSQDNLKQQLDKSFNKLLNNQLANGGWDWYGHRDYSPYITDHIVAGCYKLQRLGVKLPQADKMLDKAIRAADHYQERCYEMHLDRQDLEPGAPFFFTEEDVHYLYMRSFAPYDSVWISKKYVQNLINLMRQNLYKSNYTLQAEAALVLHRTGDKKAKFEARQIMERLRQQAVIDRDKGMYWRKEYSGYYYRWYEAPIERQALLIEAFSEISPRPNELTAMKQWLLLQKEGNSWSNTKATAEAVYALLLDTPADLLQPATTVVTVGGEEITSTEAAKAEAGTGYMQRVWNPEAMSPSLADITVRTDSTHPAFGAAYWQYLEVPDQVEDVGSGLSVRRTFYHQPAVGNGKTAEPVTADNPVRLGERITVKIVVTSDRDLEYVHVKDPRAAAFEPVNIHERNGCQSGTWWIESPRDASNSFFFKKFPQGTVVLEYDVFATQSGDFSVGAPTVECMYAPEYRAQGKGIRVTVR